MKCKICGIDKEDKIFNYFVFNDKLIEMCNSCLYSIYSQYYNFSNETINKILSFNGKVNIDSEINNVGDENGR